MKQGARACAERIGEQMCGSARDLHLIAAWLAQCAGITAASGIVCAGQIRSSLKGIH